MKLDAKQIKQFEDEGWLFLPDCFSPEEVAIAAQRGRGHLQTRPAASSGARNPARRAPPSPPTPTTRRSACSAGIRA